MYEYPTKIPFTSLLVCCRLIDGKTYSDMEKEKSWYNMCIILYTKVKNYNKYPRRRFKVCYLQCSPFSMVTYIMLFNYN